VNAIRFILVISVAALVGCSGAKSTDTNSAGATPAGSVQVSGSSAPAEAHRLVAEVDPCTFATRAEVSAALGKPASAGKHHASFGGDICTFDGPTYDYEIYIQTMQPDLVDSYAHLPGTVPVSGLGDEAVWSKDGNLFIKKGDRAVQIHFEIPGKVTQLTPPLERFSRIVVNRM
jgi:hypothetical protein